MENVYITNKGQQVLLYGWLRYAMNFKIYFGLVATAIKTDWLCFSTLLIMSFFQTYLWLENNYELSKLLINQLAI